MSRHHLARATATVVATVGLLASTVGSPASAAPSINRISLIAIGTYASGVFGGSAAEIVAHDPVSQRLFVVNADAGLVDVLDIADPTSPELIDTIVAAGSVNSVDVHDGAGAVASQADPALDPGFVELFDADGNPLASV